MPHKTDKNILKQYFRSGSRPTQNQFHELIDNCYNETFNSFVSGYQLLAVTDKNTKNSVYKREAGRTIVIPYFERINTTQKRVFHYAIPVCNLADSYVLDTVNIEMKVPENATYVVKDKNKEVQITQKVGINNIRIYNGSEEIFTAAPGKDEIGRVLELQVGKSSGKWKGIGIDIEIQYDITSDIAVSAQLNITGQKGEKLMHIFGSAGCVFVQND